MNILIDQEYGFKVEKVVSSWGPEELVTWWQSLKNINCLTCNSIVGQIPGTRQVVDLPEWKNCDAIINIHEDNDSKLRIMGKEYFHKTFSLQSEKFTV